MSPMHGEAGESLGARELADFYMRMFLEHQAFARHHESQRSAATTMFFGIPILLLTLGTALWRDGYSLLVAVGLILVAVGGVLLSLKLFERSAFHLNLANAYRDSLEVLFEETARTLLPPDRLARAKYVRTALKEREGFERAGDDFRDKKTIRFSKDGTADEKSGVRSLAGLNPAAPFSWVDPIHNQSARYLGQEAARWDLYRIWAYLFAALGVLGLLALASILLIR